jgi:cytochrome c oxidase assembly protein subunit 11
MAEGRDPARRNSRLALGLGLVVCGMVGMAFAAVPLYRVFCQVTGYGGTTQVAEVAPARALERTVTVRFEGFVDKQLPWRFAPEQREVTLRIGEPGLIFFKARNLAARPTAGVATFNVTPLKVGQYFNKVQCFCFTEQTLQPGEEVDMGVSFFVDPAIVEDANAEEVRTITLSYTFFADEEALERDGEPAPESAGAGRGTAPRPEARQTAALPK